MEFGICTDRAIDRYNWIQFGEKFSPIAWVGKAVCYIGDCSCNIVDPDATSTTCFQNGINGLGMIADGACNGSSACNNNSGSIAFGCCNYDGACSDNTETIDKDHPNCQYNGVMAAILGCVV